MSQDWSTTTTTFNVTNSTNSTLILLGAYDGQGQIATNSSYPSQIPSKATVTFYHVGTPISGGIFAYRCIVSADKAYDIGIIWNNEPNSFGGVYTWVSPAQYIPPESRGALFEQQLRHAKGKSFNTLDGITSTAEMGDGNFPTVSATISYDP